MRILVEFGLKSHTRHFESVLREIKKRGHKLYRSYCFKSDDLYDRAHIGGEDHRILHAKYARVRKDPLYFLSYLLRCTRDSLQYEQEAYEHATLIKDRIKNMLKYGLSSHSSELPAKLSAFVEGLPDDQAHAFKDILIELEDMIPPAVEVENYIKSVRPDVVCITPLILTQYGQFEFHKAARKLNIPVAYFVGSWDNLTTKGAVQLPPDATFVWNQVQVKEAVHLHGLPEDSLRVTGAPRFDDWFQTRPSQNREEFCSKWKLDPQYPILTYLCSSNLISSDESIFFREWLQVLRSSENSTLKNINVVIRPHPKFRSIWDELDLSDHKNLAICSSDGLNNDMLLFDCLFHCNLVVSINTSAELESAILGKPVFTLRHKSLMSGQDGTVHFSYLLEESGGFVRVARSIEENCAQLVRELENPMDPDKIADFVRSFIRPHGLKKNVAGIFVDYLEGMCGTVTTARERAAFVKGRTRLYNG